MYVATYRLDTCVYVSDPVQLFSVVVKVSKGILSCPEIQVCPFSEQNGRSRPGIYTKYTGHVRVM